MEASGGGGDTAAAVHANELYWSSERSVNAIAEELDISKGTLYGMIRPLPASLPCPACGTEMQFPNRTARERGLLACPGCGLAEDEAVIREAWRQTADASEDGSVVVDSPSAAGALESASGSGGNGSRALVGLALLGAAAGLFIAFVVRRR